MSVIVEAANKYYLYVKVDEANSNSLVFKGIIVIKRAETYFLAITCKKREIRNQCKNVIITLYFN